METAEPRWHSSKAGKLHAGMFYETECLENYVVHLLVVMADVYSIYFRM